MNKIENKVLKDELKFDGEIVLTYRIEYPEIVQYDYNFENNNFNKYNREKAMKIERYVITDLYREAIELYKYNKKNGYPLMQYEIIQEYNITYNKEKIISLYLDNYEYRGGAHGNTIRTSQNWNLSLGRMIPLWQLYQNKPYFILYILKEIIRQIKNQIETKENYYFENYGELVIETFNPKNYYLNENGITVFFNQYDIAPYSSGIPEFNISK